MQFPIRITKKRIIWTIIILLVLGGIGYKIFKGDDNSKNIQTEKVKTQTIKQTVLATGQVISGTDLSLSFKVSGVAANINVKEGDKVKQGQVLANLSQGDQLAALTSARGSLAQAEANYQKVLSGASSEEVAVAQVALDNAKTSLDSAKQQQTVLVKNAYQALLNSGLSAVPKNNNLTSATITVSGSYIGSQQGKYVITIFRGGTGFETSGLESVSGDASSSTSIPLGNLGLFIQFSGAKLYDGDSWTITIPNTQASTYVTNYNAYQSALQTQASAISAAQSAVDAAQAALNLKKAQVKPADLQAAEAQILSAQGQVQAASASLENTIIRAPAEGTITSIDLKVGELATALKEVVVLQDVKNLHVEAFISEANIASLKEGQTADYTYDALGPDRHFAGKVEFVNPASIVDQGVVKYKVIASMENLIEIKPGFTVNISVVTEEKPGVLVVPTRAIITRDAKKFVRVITDSEKKTYDEREVTVGLDGDGAVTEIVSGLKEGEEVVTFIKK